MSSLRFASGGTLVMPAVVPDPSFDDISSPPEWLEPERWSVPPEPGASPIVPSDEPEEDDRVQVLDPIRTPVAPAWLARGKLPSYIDEIARDPVVLPVSSWPRLAAAAALSLIALSAVASAAILLV
jgi:hypothetical protein